jgi:hypothetical protein
MTLCTLPTMYFKEGPNGTQSTIMGKSTEGREDLSLEDLRNAIDAFIGERDWEGTGALLPVVRP